MAPRRLTPEGLQEVRGLASRWGNIVARRAFGDEGPGPDTALAGMGQVAAAGLTEATLSCLPEQHARRLGGGQPCPACGRRCPARREPRPSVVGGGRLVPGEPVCYCPACRRDFSPPATSSGP